MSQPNYKDQRAVEWNLQVQQQLADYAVQSGICGVEEHAAELHRICQCGAACVTGEYAADSRSIR